MRLSAGWMFLVAFLSLVPALPVRAADVDFPSPDTAVNAFGTTTYLDLARHFVPDIAPSDSGYVGKQLISLRHLDGSTYDKVADDSYGFFDIARTTMKTDGKDRMLILFDLSQAAKASEGIAVLALYDVSHEAKLLDAVNVGFDQSTYFFDQGLLSVSKGDDVILTMSSHFNSSQSYTTQSMILVRNDRFELVDTAFLFGDRLCSVERQQNIRYAANPGDAKPLAPISVFVTESVTPTGEQCEGEKMPAVGQREIRVTYKWDLASNRYVKDSDALDKLAKANEERF